MFASDRENLFFQNNEMAHHRTLPNAFAGVRPYVPRLSSKLEKEQSLVPFTLRGERR